jgi:hypothetical protein
MQTKWVEGCNDDFWALCREDGIWTGLTISKLSPYFGDPDCPVCYHLRFYPQHNKGKDYDIGDTLTLREAQAIKCIV